MKTETLTRSERLTAILLSERRSLERFNYLTSLTDEQVKREYERKFN